MIGTTAGTTSFVGSPRIELEPPPEQTTPRVDLYHVAYHRDESSYEDLLRALMQKVSVMQKQLATMTDR